MKLIISESQLRKVINEIGGFDDTKSMGRQSTLIQNNVLVRIAGSIDVLKQIITLINDEKIDSETIVELIEQLIEIVDENVNVVDAFIPEIYLDDDYKMAMIEYSEKLKKFINKLEMIKFIAMDTDISKLKSIFMDVLGKMFEVFHNFGNLANKINMRYIKRMGLDLDLDPSDN